MLAPLLWHLWGVVHLCKNLWLAQYVGANRGLAIVTSMTSVATKTLIRKSACALQYGFVGARSLTGERVSGHPIKLDEWAGIKVDVFLQLPCPQGNRKRTFIAITPCDSVYEYSTVSGKKLRNSYSRLISQIYPCLLWLIGSHPCTI